MNQKNIITDSNSTNVPTNFKSSIEHDYKYWKTKPIFLKSNDTEKIINSENIEADLGKRKVYSKNEELPLPKNMVWKTMDTNNLDNLEQIKIFFENYYESCESDDQFKKKYTTNFLKWALGEKNICLSIVLNTNSANDLSNEKIIGFISAKIENMTVFDKSDNFAVITFLCADLVYRKKNIAQVLIDELTRRCVKHGIQQGCFLTPRYIPSPVMTFRTYYRPINYLKLQKYNFVDLEMMKQQNKKNPEKIHDMLQVDCDIKFDQTYNLNCVQMVTTHMDEVYKKYKMSMSKFNIHKNYTKKELECILLKNDIVKSYIIQDNNNNLIDFFSYYKLDYITKDNNLINGAYLFLYSCEMNNDKFIKNILKKLKDDNVDVFLVVDNMMIPEIIYSEILKNDEDSDDESFTKSYQYGFLKSSDKKFFNFFNWKCSSVKFNQICWNEF